MTSTRRIDRTLLAWPRRTLNIAHRGDRSRAPENTLAAAALAFDAGADMWELDVQLSADGEPVVFHDDTLERTTDLDRHPEFAGRPARVDAFTLAELKQLSAGAWFLQTDPFGRIQSGQIPAEALSQYPEQRIPTLEEALRFTSDRAWRVNVEIKDLSGQPGHGRVVETVTGLIGGLGMADRVLLSSFHHPYLVQAKNRIPRLATAALVEEAGFAPFKVLGECGAEAWHPAAWLVNDDETRALRAAGYLVNVWTVNAQPDMDRFLALGVDGLFTDDPLLLAGRS